jgi:hypothetical protein
MINELWEVNSGGRTISQEDSRLDFYCGGGVYLQVNDIFIVFILVIQKCVRKSSVRVRA